MALAAASYRMRMDAMFKSSIMESLYAERLERDTLKRKVVACGKCCLLFPIQDCAPLFIVVSCKSVPRLPLQNLYVFFSVSCASPSSVESHLRDFAFCGLVSRLCEVASSKCLALRA